MRRFSRSSSVRNSQNSQHSRDSTGPPLPNTSTGAQHTGQTPPTSYTPPLDAHGQQQYQPLHSAPNGGAITGSSAPGGAHQQQQQGYDSRPISAATNSSFDFMNRPLTQQHHGPLPSGAMSGLSRTDQVVLRYFWEDKYADNAKRDLHFLKFPFFPQYPNHKDLMPYCEIYHLVKTSPGASIVSLGSANGVYIGFELSQGAQLHIDMDDEWRDISHHRVVFKPFETMLRDPTSEATFKAWPKPLTIEFLEEQYLRWTQDLTSFCWLDEPVRELGAGTGSTTGPNGGDDVAGEEVHHTGREI